MWRYVAVAVYSSTTPSYSDSYNNDKDDAFPVTTIISCADGFRYYTTLLNKKKGAVTHVGQLI